MEIDKESGEKKRTRPYVVVTIDIFEHLKTRRCARDLNLSPEQFVIHLMKLWMWSWKFRENGDLDGMEDHEIADAAGYSGDETTFVRSLIERGWLDSGPLRIHDWFEHTGKTIGDRKANSERMRRHRKEGVPERTNTVQERACTVQERACTVQERADTVRACARPDQIRSDQIKLIKIPPTPLLKTAPDSEPLPTEVGCGDVDGVKAGQIDVQGVEEWSGHTETPPAPKKKRQGAESDLTPEEVAEIWNAGKAECHSAVNASKLNSERKRKIEKRLRDFPMRQQWETAMGHVRAWEYGHGANDGGWLAHFDWLLSSKGTRAFEGILESGSKTVPRPRGPVPIRSAASDSQPREQPLVYVSEAENEANLRSIEDAARALATKPTRRR